MSSSYERELKGILEGDMNHLEKITKSCSVFEKTNYECIRKKPFVVIRAAGSFGVDLVAVRGDISVLIEIKASIEDVLHFSSVDGKLQRQAQWMQQTCEKTKTLPMYAFRLKGFRGDCWRLFTLDVSGLEGRIKIVHNHLPKLARSKNGNYIMRFHDGLPLADFISYICR